MVVVALRRAGASDITRATRGTRARHARTETSRISPIASASGAVMFTNGPGEAADWGGCHPLTGL